LYEPVLTPKVTSAKLKLKPLTSKEPEMRTILKELDDMEFLRFVNKGSDMMKNRLN
jgi:hypothetical protein